MRASRRTAISRQRRNRLFTTGLILLLAGAVLTPAGRRVRAVTTASRFQEPQTAVAAEGFALLEESHYEAARDYFRAALRRSPRHPRLLLGMGRALLELPAGGDRALDYLRRAALRDRSDPDIRYWKAMAHIHMARTETTAGNARAALRDLERVLELDPLHEDAWYRIGSLQLETFEDIEAARQSWRNQIDVYPDHLNARLALLMLDMGVGDWEGAITTARDIIEREPERWEAYPWLAGAYWKDGRADDAIAAFERCFPHLPDDERDLYFDLGLVLSSGESEEWTALSEAGREEYRRRYWEIRDPDPQTATNERLLEHWIRIAYARIEFGREEWPWDARGEAYVRYGEPDVRTGPGMPYPRELVETDWEYYENKKELYAELGMSPPTYSPEYFPAQQAIGRVYGDGTPETWYYLDTGFQLSFTRPAMGRRYMNDSRYLTERLTARLPVISEEEERIDIFSPLQIATAFRGEGNRTALEYAIGLTPDDFGLFQSFTGEYATIDVRMQLLTPGWIPVAGAVDSVTNLPTSTFVEAFWNEFFVHGARLEAPPGEYIFTTLILDPVTGRRSIAEENVILPDFRGSDLMISGILPAASIAPAGEGSPERFVRGDLEVIPLPGRTLGTTEPLFIYFEVYNLTRDEVGATRYRVEYSVAESDAGVDPVSRITSRLLGLVGLGGRRAMLSSEVESSGIDPDLKTWLEIDMSRLPFGIYDLIVTVSDLNSGDAASSTQTFRTIPPPREVPQVLIPVGKHE